MNSAASLIFFEDRQVDNFYPLTLSHIVGELRCGIVRLAEKWCRRFSATNVYYLTRPELRDFLTENSGLTTSVGQLKTAQVLLVNPRFLPDDEIVESLKEGDTQIAFKSGDVPVALRLNSDSVELKSILEAADQGYERTTARIEEIATALNASEVELTRFDYLWDLIRHNAQQIIEDFQLSQTSIVTRQQAVPDPDCLVYHWDDIYLSPGVRVDGQVVLDARGGPIYVGPDAVICAHTRVEGPAFIGAGSQLVGGRIREGCSFGPQCRVGGEVEESIFHGYTNKYHDGFIGHAYLGEWVNLGALTTNSDLKNNYGSVKVELPGGLLNTGQSKVGSFVGDHVKTGIGTLLTTGMVIGFGTNLFGGGLAGQRFLPGFLWGGKDGFVEYELKKAVETAEAVLPRRGRELGPAAKALFAKISASESELRQRFVA